MIDIQSYRHRIGYFNQVSKTTVLIHRKKSEYGPNCQNSDKPNSRVISNRIVLIYSISLFLVCIYQERWTCLDHYSKDSASEVENSCVKAKKSYKVYVSQSWSENQNMYLTLSLKSPNKYAKITYGNRDHLKKGMKNLHLNIRSLRNKVSDVKLLIKQHKPHVFGISECELHKTSNWNTDQLKIPGYDLLLPKSWDVHGFARIVIYVKSSLEYEQVTELEHDLIQSIWIKSGFKNCKKMLYCHAYREHTCTLGSSIRNQKSYLEEFLSQWDKAANMNIAGEPSEIHIAGDMNLDALEDKWLKPSYHLYSLSKLVHAACNLGNFSQLVKTPTRFQQNSVSGSTSFSTLDHVYTNRKFRCSDISVHPFGNSDHDLVSYVRISKEPTAPAKIIRKRSYKNFIINDFLQDLKSVDWSVVYGCDEVDLAVYVFTRLFIQVLDQHAPLVTYQQRKKYSPWVTTETIDLIKKRDEAKARASHLAKSGLDSKQAWAEFKSLRNKVCNRLKFEEITYKQEKIKSSLESPSRCWAVAKDFMNWNSSSGPPDQLLIDGNLVRKSSLIAHEMNNYFLNKVKLIRDGIGSLPTNFMKCQQIMKNKSCKLWLNHISKGKILHLLKGLKNTKSSSIDGLDNFCVKIAADVIVDPVHHIVALSLMQCKFPTNWKLSKVIPLHKKGSTLDRKNFRPVAILSPISKILEKVIYEQLYKYFTCNKLFNQNFHGFRVNRSTLTALISMYDRWVKAAAAGQVSGVILIDLSSAFDLVTMQSF